MEADAQDITVVVISRFSPFSYGKLDTRNIRQEVAPVRCAVSL